MHDIFWIMLVGSVCTGVVLAAADSESDRLSTSAGDVTMTFIGHGTLMFAFNGHVLHVDPWSALADYSKLPKADLILITHEHRDHFDPAAIQPIRTPETAILLPASCTDRVAGSTIITNGQSRSVLGIGIAAVPAYNIQHRRPTGQPYHPAGAGNGYVLTFADKRVYVAGDTEKTPEMQALKDITVAFLPMNLPYTMTPEMVADAALAFKPRILYPYHYGETDPDALAELLEGSGIDVRIRTLR